MLDPLLPKPGVVAAGVGVVSSKSGPKFRGMIFDFQMGQLVKKDVAKDILRKKKNLPIEVKIAFSGARTIASALIFDGNTVIFKAILRGEVRKVLFD